MCHFIRNSQFLILFKRKVCFKGLNVSVHLCGFLFQEIIYCSAETGVPDPVARQRQERFEPPV